MTKYRYSINFDYFNTYTFASGNAGFYIMKIKCSWSSCWKQIKRAFIFNTPVIKLIQFLAHAGENTHRYNLGKKLISWSLDFTN